MSSEERIEKNLAVETQENTGKAAATATEDGPPPAAPANGSAVPAETKSADAMSPPETHSPANMTSEANVSTADASEANAAEAAADSQEAAAAASEEADEARASAADSGHSARRRLRLNPIVDPDQFKPIPTYATATEPPVQKRAAAVSSAPAPTAPPAREDRTERPETPSAAKATPPIEPAGQPETGSAASLESAPVEDSSAVPEAVPTTAAESAEEATAREAKAPARRAAPVELPPEIELEADLEAQIAAAMSGVESAEREPIAPIAEISSEQVAQQTDETELEEGARLKGKVQSIHGDDVFLDLGFRSPGLVQLRQFGTDKQPEVGQEIDVLVSRVDDAEGLIYCSLPRGARKPAGNWDDVTPGQIVDCVVTKSNKGGLEVTVSSLRGFLPAGQVDLRYIGDLEPFVGQKLRVQVVEVNPKKRNLVVSRRAYLELERQEAEEMLWAKLELDQTYSGTVKTLKDYGAFIDIGGVDGFLHIGEISWTRINHPSDVLHEGQQVEVKVLSLDPKKKKIGLGMRQLAPNPWSTAEANYRPGSTASGTVTRTTDFGAFVELEPGIEGLIHISELDYRRVRKVTEVVNVGQSVDVQVLEVDPERKRISLSLKALQAKPQAEEQPADQPSAPPPAPQTRKRQAKLKGGIGGASKGGLFGNPKDFG